jgi:hypothetical protein
MTEKQEGFTELTAPGSQYTTTYGSYAFCIWQEPICETL